MVNGNGRLNGKWLALSIRARLMVLAAIAMLPLLGDRIRAIETGRAERIEAASKQALMLARQGMTAQNEAIVSLRAFLQMAASAHGPMTARDEHCGSFLSDAVKQVLWLKSLSLVEPGGRIICSSNPDVVGANISHLPHFIQAMKTGEFAMSDYFVGKVTGPTLFTALPHRAADHSIDVLVSAPLELVWFTQVASALANSFSAEVMMVDGAGTVLARQPSHENWVGRRFADHPVIRTMLASPEGVVTGEGVDGVPRVFGFVKLPGTNARLAVGLDESEVLHRVNREFMTSIAGLGLVSAVILLGIWFGGERLFVRPIRSLTRMAQRIGRGEYRARATEFPWAPEFVPLAAALDDMAGQLANRERELRQSNGHLRELAYIDAMTGIANRRAFNARLTTEWQLAAERRHPIAVLVVDVDHFKEFNDHYGHIRGDECLRELGEVLKAGARMRSGGIAKTVVAAAPAVRPFVAREADFTARYGGEEFAVLLQGADLNAAMNVADGLRRAIEDLRLLHVASPRGFVTVSVGVASIVPRAGDSAQHLVEHADAGLYEAKRRGRNVVVAHCELTLSRAS